MNKMKLKTDIFIEPSLAKITHHAVLLTVGSCFSEHIGRQLYEHGFHVTANPVGTTFNLRSLKRIFESTLAKLYPTAQDLDYNNLTGLYHHYDWHSSFNHPEPQKVIHAITDTMVGLYKSIANADFIMVTLGTATVYARQDNDEVVNNCHKMPGHLFYKKTLNIEEQIADLSNLKDMIFELNKKAKILLTLSPVRHIKDGLVNAQYSKSLLRCVIETNLDERTSYFPAYEIMMDDLRDYRFYEKDLIHPNEQAISYIWELFGQTYFDEDTLQLNQIITQIKLAIHHRPIHQNTPAYQQHIIQTQAKVEALVKKFPFLSRVFGL